MIPSYISRSRHIAHSTTLESNTYTHTHTDKQILLSKAICQPPCINARYFIQTNTTVHKFNNTYLCIFYLHTFYTYYIHTIRLRGCTGSYSHTQHKHIFHHISYVSIKHPSQNTISYLLLFENGFIRSKNDENMQQIGVQ